MKFELIEMEGRTAYNFLRTLMAPKFIVIDFDEIDFLKTLIFSWEANFKMLVLSFPIFSFLLPLMLFYPFLKF